jgi:hypothetical protein
MILPASDDSLYQDPLIAPEALIKSATDEKIHFPSAFTKTERISRQKERVRSLDPKINNPKE